MTVSVRPWPEIAADLRMGHAHGIGGRLDNEAAVAGDALAAKLAAVHASLPDCPTCGGTAAIGPPADGRLSSGPCPDCDDGKVSVAQMAALWERVWDPTLDSDPQYPSSGKLAIVGQLRGVW